ncbi:MAG TPA: methylenetetrahydrofolate reductase [NAD(P)H] [Bacillota bacterium]|nr:methylenetetrahydrofolate reductase [NAD(P)H] [Bacillota bacterium]
MKTRDMFKRKRVLSFEIFPPKRTGSIDSIYETVTQLRDINPDFIGVTYGAGGGDNKHHTFSIAANIKNRYGIESVAHLPCINLTRADVLAMLKDLEEAGIKNILALRGDINPDIQPREDFKYASDLVSFIKDHGDFNIIGACYPEGHMDCPSIIEDVRNLKIKVDAGTDHLISQLFFDNNLFYSFLERADIAGIGVPIQAGIMPVVNKRQIERMVTLCGASLPKKFLSIMDRYENKPEALRDAGIAYAIDQIVDLIAQGVDGIHIYTMNNPYIARRIYQAINILLAA